jgi:HEPN domain-containing protein
MSEPPPSEDAREWISRARSDLALARAKPEGVYLEDLCFHAQQSAEKAIKALLIWHGIEFPYVHDLAALLTLVEKATGDLPDSIRQAERLTQFAVETRYPGAAPPVREGEYQEAIGLASEVLRWAEKQLESTQH